MPRICSTVQSRKGKGYWLDLGDGTESENNWYLSIIILRVNPFFLLFEYETE